MLVIYYAPFVSAEDYYARAETQHWLNLIVHIPKPFDLIS